jgi:murein DD-endopeptidase MepM/ murein hydrolase activator NlpD
VAAGAAITFLAVAAWLLWPYVRPEGIPPEPVLTGTPSEAPELAARRLAFPVRGMSSESLTDTFDDPRGGGARRHEAVDIAAPRGTPVVAVEDGSVLRLHRSGAGGLSVYHLDPTGRFTYYYAHLDAYAPGLAEGRALRRGDVLGYVGTTGNAPPTAPHLHFAVFERTDPKRWWTGRPVNPYSIWR